MFLMEKSENFQEGIHADDYGAEFTAVRLERTALDTWYRETESLDGRWRYAADPYDTCLRQKWFEENYFDSEGRALPVDFDFDAWEAADVPSCWNLQTEKLFWYEGPMVFTRRFTYVNHGEDRVFIQFGAANYQAAVFVNKKFMGTHFGGSTPFCVEVTDVLERDNRIVVVVNNTRRKTNVPCENTDWFNYGGIYRGVEIIRLPKAFIRNFRLWLEPGTDFKKIGASVEIDGAWETTPPPSEAPLHGRGMGTAVVTVPELNLKMEIAVADGKGEAFADAAPGLWSCENPRLYDAEVSFGGDTLRDRVGFREMKAEGSAIYLNGKKIFLKGVCAHEDSTENGKAVTDAEIRRTFALAKEMNCNFMRLAHYPHTERAARIADEMGLLLWEEIPVYWAIAFGSAETYRDAENQLAELVARDFNRASVAIWSIGNENADTDARLKFMTNLARKAKALDHTRPVSAACLVDGAALAINDRLCAEIDIVGINEYYGWYEPDFSKLAKIFANSAPGKPVIISEFGADAKPGARGTVDDLFTEDKQLDVYRKQIAAFKAELSKPDSFLCGASPWILFDFRCPRRANFFQGYYNLKGLLSAEKEYKKPAFFVMQKFYEEV